jgi:pSer/pThr/pTyr-binding forkhead associated (FHA) protein
VRDLGSTNGVKVNGRRLDAARAQSLKPGDVLELGTSRITFDVK